MTTPDACIWQSAQNILRVQENLNKLYHAFDLIECSEKDLVIECEDEDEADGDFIQPVWNTYYSIKKNSRKNAKTVAWVTVAIQLTSDEGNEAEWRDGKRAKVLVGCSPSEDREAAWCFLSDAPNSAGYCDDCDMRETHWEMNDEGVISWFYAIPLDLLTSTREVRKYIVTPLHEILGGGDMSKVLAKFGDQLCLPPKHK